MSGARLANNLFLSYLLAPDLFGIMAIANIILQGVQMCSDVGVGHCLIQNAKGDSPVFYNTAWTIQLVRGVLIWTLLIAISGPIASFYAEPQLRLIVVALGSTALIQSAASTEIHTAKRHLRIAWITSLEVASQIIGIIVMCALAYKYKSVWCLVFGAIVSASVFAILSHLLSKTVKNRLTWNHESACELIRFGKWILIGMLLSFLAMQIDRLLLGKLGDFTQLGLYHFAFSLSLLASTIVERLSNTVQFPILAAVANSSSQNYSERAIESRQSLLIIAMALLTLLFAAAPLIFNHLYHENFRDAGWITQLMCFPIWCLVLTKTIDRALLAIGDTRSLAYLAFCRLIFCSTFSYIGYVTGGLQGFCVGVGVGSLTAHLCLYVPLRRCGIRILAQDIRFSLLAVLVALIGLTVQNPSLVANLSPNVGDPALVGHCVALALATVFAAAISLQQWRVVVGRNGYTPATD
tara:strand:- start:116052 stop:117449 length:1398 start_codon:yes stop_codon:yes gene_type:complete